MDYGKILSYSVDGNRVKAQFENSYILIDVITENILRVLDPVWMEDYVSVAIEGEKAVDTEFKVSLDGSVLTLATSKARLTITDDFGFELYNMHGERVLKTFSGKRTIMPRLTKKDIRLLEAEGHSFANVNETEYKVQQLFELAENDAFYGLGDKTGYLNKRGYAYENWNSDIPDIHHENMPALYKSIPFVIGKKRDGVFGIFFDNTFHSYLDFGKESSEYFFYGADDGNLDMYLILGDRIKDIVKEYTYLTGRPELPALWTLGYHQCRWGYQSAEDIREVAHKMRENKIPCESVQYDIDYMEGYRVFTWDEEEYGKAGDLFYELGESGFKPVVIIDPATKKDPGYFMYDEGLANDYFAHGADGKVYENAVWPGTSTYPDFGRSDVRKWWADSHKKLTDMGVMGVWNDMNEPASFNGPLPLDVQFHVNDRKTTHAEAHNTYGHFMSRATNEGMRKLTGRRPLVITRACYAGTQKYSTVWTGDNQSVWSHLRMLVPQLCNLGLSGFSIAGTDIGGFGGDTTEELLSRWIEAAAFSTFFRNHSAKGTRSQEPWQFSEKSLNIYRKYVELHYQFLPYIYDLLYKSQETGLPVMRPLVLQYENDKNVRNLNDEFLVGKDILVAPVMEQGATSRMVYLPDGWWIDFWTKERILGGQYIIKEAPLDVLPIYLHANAIIPTYEPVQYVGEKEYDKLVLISTGANCKYEHYQDNGEDFAYQNGEYNLYQFETDENGKLSEIMIHDGYKKYKTIEVVTY